MGRVGARPGGRGGVCLVGWGWGQGDAALGLRLPASGKTWASGPLWAELQNERSVKSKRAIYFLWPMREASVDKASTKSLVAEIQGLQRT